MKLVPKSLSIRKLHLAPLILTRAYQSGDIHFVRANQTTSVSVPEGHYRFQYATGSGYSNHCGRFLTDTQSCKDSRFTEYIAQRRPGGFACVVQTYTLVRVSHGNFTPGRINVSDI